MISCTKNIALLIVLILGGMTTFGFCEAAQNEENRKNTSRQVEQLIEQLGSPSYAEREQAEAELLEYHMEAFEPLVRAQKHNDLEIAARARYLVRQIQVNLVMPDDSPRVAKLMRNIFTLDRRKQEGRIAELAMLPQGEGLAALCRLLRFSESETSAKMTAVGIMQSRLYDKKDLAAMANKLSSPEGYPGGAYPSNIYQTMGLFVDTLDEFSDDGEQFGQPLGQQERDEIRRLLKSCDRPAAALVFAWLDFEEAKTDEEKKAAYDQWDKLCLHEESLLENNPVNITPAIFSSLLTTQIKKATELHLGEDTQIDLVRRQLKRTHFWNRTNYKEMIDRLIDEKIWNQADISIPEFGQVMIRAYNQDTLPRFFCLLLQAGKTKEADELFDLYEKSSPAKGSAKATLHWHFAMILIQEGFYDRAIAQHEAAIQAEDLKQPRNPERLICWSSFQGILDMYEGLEQFELAAKTSDQMLQKIESLSDAQKERDEIVLLTKNIKSQSAYYRAMAEKKNGNEAAYRKMLGEAFDLNHESCAVLIECYHLPLTPTDQKFHDWIVDQIHKTVASLSQQVKGGKRTSREETANLAAWLVANTEGDLDSVIEPLESVSNRALNLNSGILDTLALCYYKKGDLEKAVSLQREAIELVPHDRRLQKSWETFSTAYEKKTGKKPEAPKSGTARFRMMIGLPPKL